MWRALVTFLAVGFALFVNYVGSGAVVLEGYKTVAQVSDSVPTLFTPAGYVFAIWGVIYLGLIMYAIYRAMPSSRCSGYFAKADMWFWISCVLNGVWIIAWDKEDFAFSVLIMVALLLSLVALTNALGIGRVKVSMQERWMVHIPISIYLAWICVATIANISAFIYSQTGIYVFLSAPELWTVLMLIIAGVLGVAALLYRRSFAFSIVIIWATIGIAVKQNLPILTFVIFFVVLAQLLGMVYVSLPRNKRKMIA